MTNCPNCGAPVQGAVCEYCGTRFSLQPSDELINAGISKSEDFMIMVDVDVNADEILEVLSRQGAIKIPMSGNIKSDR